MKLIKVVIVLALAAAIFGIVAFFAWKLYIKPEQIERQAEKAEASAPPPTPPPDYSLQALEAPMALKKAGKLPEARDALLNFIVQYPQSTKLADAKAAVGEINTQLVFTSDPGPDKLDYTVVGGDSLVKVSNKTKSNAELILRSNNLASIDLSVGQQLRIPQLDISLVIDRQAKTLSVLNKGQLFKEYPLLALDLPGAARGKDPVQTTIKDKIAIKGAGRVAFGSRDYVGSERWLMLGVTNAVIRGKPGDSATMPPGIVVSQEDIEEIFPLVAQRTPVTIQ
ncbi:MAG TPA: LysM peptidoglycan-binding domain-containing protein [Chthoniobacterales bacterium]|nr:LysM peptidoglycan-binding domain-containing protein [Chthoniobacterales bacterium]